MADRGGSASGTAAKRPRTDNDADDHHHLRRIVEQLTVSNEELTSRVDELTANNGELTTRNEELAARVAELESAIKDLRLRGEENHDDSLLPVEKTATVDLSRVDPTLVAHVASFLGLSRELLSLALTCKTFGWRQSSSAPSGSLVEEAARGFLANQMQPSDVERDALPQYNNETTTWLPILNELEQLRLPLKFSKLIGADITYSGSDSRVKGHSDSRYKYSTAMTDYVMRRGIHYATFNLINGRGTVIGVSRPLHDYDVSVSAYAEEIFSMFDARRFGGLLAQRTDKWVGDVHCCRIVCGIGLMQWTNWAASHSETEGPGGFDKGDTAGLLVDLNRGTLTVYKNGRRLRLAKDGLAGQYCFFAALSGGGEVSIERGTPSGAS